MTGPKTRVRWLTVMRSPSASPERPAAELLNICMVTIGWPHPMPSPNANASSDSAVLLLKKGTSMKLSAPAKNAPASTLFSWYFAIRRGRIRRTTNAAAEFIASTTPMADAERPAPCA